MSDLPFDAHHLRLIWPQWQGAQSATVADLASEFSLADARQSYAIGSAVLQAILPAHDGPTEVVPVAGLHEALEEQDGIESKAVLLHQMTVARALIRKHNPQRISVLGGDCSVSIVPFAMMAAKYGSDLAVIWIDAHPDIDEPSGDYSGLHAMAVSALIGSGDADILNLLPVTIPPQNIALAGVHQWADPTALPRLKNLGMGVFGPSEIRSGAAPLLDWIEQTGATKVAIHFDVDVIDSDEVRFGLGEDRGGLLMQEAGAIVREIEAAYEVVALSITEFIPRSAVHLESLLRHFPLIGR